MEVPEDVPTPATNASNQPDNATAPEAKEESKVELLKGDSQGDEIQAYLRKRINEE